MRQLLIATHNPAKLEDYKSFAAGLPVEIVSLDDVGVTQEFEEIHSTMEQNARAKAEFYQKLSGLPTLADDSGIEIPFYRMEPGVNTKHWDGRGLNDDDYLKFIVDKIQRIPPGQRQAQLRAVESYCDGRQTVLEQGVIKGLLTDKIYREGETKGYPWDLVFIIDGLNKYYEEVTDPNYNHRKWAFDKLKPYFLRMTEGRQITIVVAIITNEENEILLAKRHEPEAEHSHGKWEFLGGGIDFGETPEQAVVREAKEEGGVDIQIDKLLPEVFSNIWEFGDGSKQQVLLISYKCKIISGAPRADLEHNTSELKFYPLEDIKKLDTLPKIYEMAKLALTKV